MATPAQAEFNDLMRDKSHRSNHPEDDNDDARSFLNLSDDDEDRTPPASIQDPDEYIPRASMSSGRPTIPRTRYGANTGPKGVISDAQNYRDSQRVHRTSLRSTSTLPQHIGQKLSRREQILEEKRGEEDDEDDEFGLEDGDGEFMSKWREGRLKELQGGGFESKMHSRVRQRRLYGAMVTVDGDGYLEAVEGSGGDTVVVVYIYDDISQVSQAIEDCLQTLAQKHQDVRFVKLHYQDAEMEPAGVPALIAYKAGEKFAGLVPIVGEIPEDAELSALSLESVLQRYEALGRAIGGKKEVVELTSRADIKFFDEKTCPTTLPSTPTESAAQSVRFLVYLFCGVSAMSAQDLLTGLALKSPERTLLRSGELYESQLAIHDKAQLSKLQTPAGTQASEHETAEGSTASTLCFEVECTTTTTSAIELEAASTTTGLLCDIASDHNDGDLDGQMRSDAMVAMQWTAAHDAKLENERRSHLMSLPAELRNSIVEEVVSGQPIELAIGCGPQLQVPRHLLAIAQTCRGARVHAPQAKHQIRVRLRLCQGSLIGEANTCIDRAHGLEEVQRNISPALHMAGIERIKQNGLEVGIGRLPMLGEWRNLEHKRYNELADGISAAWGCLRVVRKTLQRLAPAAQIKVSVDMSGLFMSSCMEACHLGQLRPLIVRYKKEDVDAYFEDLRDQFWWAYRHGRINNSLWGELDARAQMLNWQALEIMMGLD
nr:hypothetical protein B0A51_04450 [Rachicladosporium sp. CCFEE 5018]